MDKGLRHFSKLFGACTCETDNSIRQSISCSFSRKIIPRLSFSSHKGELGRIGVIGGCSLYTGAPYYAATAALRCGADLCTIFTSKDAAPPIKTYSPELMVVPHYSPSDWISRLHVSFYCTQWVVCSFELVGVSYWSWTWSRE